MKIYAPSPWTNDGRGIIHDAQSRIVAILESEANGNLIAAAPDLLTNLQKAIDALQDLAPDSDYGNLVRMDAIVAIAKATR